MMQNSIPDRSFNILECWRIIWRFRYLIAVLVVVSVVVTGVVSKLSPKLYEAKATLLPVPPEPMGGGMSFGGMGGKDKGGGAGGGGGGSLALDLVGGKSSGPSMVDTLLVLLGSRFLAERVIDQLNLMQYYGLTSKSDAINALLGEISYIQTTNKAIQITILSRNPKVAADIANTYVFALDAAYREVSVASTKKNKIFIEARLAEKTKKLLDSENALMAFQKENRILDPQEQMTGAVGMAADLHGRIIELEVELAALREYAQPFHPEIAKLEAQISALRRELEKQEADQVVRAIGVKRKRTSLAKQVFPLFDEAPTLAFDYLRLMRNQRVEEGIYGMLVGMLEAAKLAEVRDVPTIHLLDAAVPPEVKSRPKTLQNVLAAGVVSLVFGILLSFFLVHLEGVKTQDAARKMLVGYGTEEVEHDSNGNGKVEDAVASVAAKEAPHVLR